MSVDAGVGAWLRAGALYAEASDSSVATKWGDTAVETTIMTPYALEAAAEAEGARHLDILKHPLVTETHNVPGLRSDLLGKAVTMFADQLGYDDGLDVFVIGVEEQSNVERTILTVLRRLA